MDLISHAESSGKDCDIFAEQPKAGGSLQAARTSVGELGQYMTILHVFLCFKLLYINPQMQKPFI